MEPVFLAYAIWVHKNATPKNWLMQVKGLNNYLEVLTDIDPTTVYPFIGNTSKIMFA